MKSIVAFLVFLACILSLQFSHADESKIGNFNFVYPYQVFPAYLSNQAGFTQQLVLTDIKENGIKTHMYTLGERLVLDMKLHDRIGVFGRFQGSFNAGGELSSNLGSSNVQFSAGESWNIESGFNIKLFRAEESSTQISTRAYFSHGKSEGVLVDTSNLQLDEEYYKSLSLFIPISDIIDHAKEDVISNLNKLSYQSKTTSSLGGLNLSIAQALHPNFGLQFAFGTSIGNKEITIDRKKSTQWMSAVNLDVAVDVKLQPITPVTIQMEYSYQPQSIGQTNHVWICSLVYERPNLITFGPSIGKVFYNSNQETWFGNITAHLFF
jgi:hypothetical protein